ncbi:CaiB/BaiF CoA-transferase family protein [Sporosarcina sp. ZBG7A]|uniref:CaiB/BaiF CoA transferase family protein n=1 Tax=Sporosarcina sp. ZBG7A TaxID=1582223 RepID=UPI00057AD0DC|nr:CoA transferase [Sporosarcina sp. ZBG7A]
MGNPLEGVRILDLSWIFSGPFSTLLLQQLGAEVVKLEVPDAGDPTRQFPSLRNGASAYHYMLNRNKNSISLNLKEPDGIEGLKKILPEFDVLIENFVPGKMEKLGLGYEQLKQKHPSLIYASISGFGSSGPYSSRPCIDPIAQAMGGLMALTGDESGRPFKTGPGITDALSGIYLALGVVSALLEREKTGLGQQIEVSMLESTVAVLEDAIVNASMNEHGPTRKGNTDPFGLPWDSFQTRDGKWVMVCALGKEQYERAFRLIDREDIIQDYPFAMNEEFQKHAPQLNQIFGEWVQTQEVDSVLMTLRKNGILAGDVKSIDQILEDPHLNERGMFTDISHEQLGDIKVANLPILFDGHRPGKMNEPRTKRVGEDNEKVLNISKKGEGIR